MKLGFSHMQSNYELLWTDTGQSEFQWRPFPFVTFDRSGKWFW